jgi:cytochrome b561
MDRPTDRRYTSTAQTLHWLIALLIVLQFGLAKMAAHLPLGMRKLSLLAEHKSVGMTLLILAVVRLAWRFTHAPPPLPAQMPRVEQWLAKASHFSFYVILFAMPLSGWLMSSAKNYSVSWFGWFTWPNLIGKNEAAFNFLRSTHDALSYVLFSIAILHILAALKHHFWNKDDVLLRMLPFTKPEKKS